MGLRDRGGTGGGGALDGDIVENRGELAEMWGDLGGFWQIWEHLGEIWGKFEVN